LQISHRELEHAIQTKVPFSSKRTGKENNAWIEIDGIQVSRITFPKTKGSNTSCISTGLEKSIRNQLCLSKELFKDFIKCPLTREKYIEELRSKNSLKE